MSYADEIARARRLAILLALHFLPGYTASITLLREQIGRAGYVASIDLMQTELAWLAEQGLIETPQGLAGDANHITARLTQRGQDVALGCIQTPGVRRPNPGGV